MSAPIVFQTGLVLIKPLYTVDPDTGNHPSNVLWFLQRAPVTLTVANATTIANAFDALWSPIYTAYGGTAQQYVGSYVQDYSSNFGVEYTSVGHFTPVGGSNGPSAPPNVAALISLNTGEHYRGGHARIYLPYVAKSLISTTDPSMLSAGISGAITTKYVLLEPGMNAIGVGGGLSQRVYRHRTIAGSARLDPIQQLTVHDMLATQRRRLRKAPHH